MTHKYDSLLGLQGIQVPRTSASAEHLKPLLESMLKEALPLMRSMPAVTATQTKCDATTGDTTTGNTTTGNIGTSRGAWRTKGTKKFANSSAPVHLFERSVTHANGKTETWAARRSVHADAASRGTASWAEMERSFKEEHAAAEQAFTPSVESAREVQRWECGDVVVQSGEETWGAWTLRVDEAVHRLPGPLRRRVFRVLQATSGVCGRRDFVVVQIAVGQGGEGHGDDSLGNTTTNHGVVRGAYSSVERVRDLGGGLIEWTMATVSDAKGVLPPWMQRMAVPGQIAKDVDLFMAWIASQRQG